MDLKDIGNPAVKIEVTTEKRKVNVFLAVAIFFFPYLFAWFTLRKGHTTASRVFSFAWMFIVFVIIGSNDDKSSQVTTVPVAHPPKITESCKKLSNMFGAESQLSDLQKDEMWKQFEGRPFTWKLEVTEVSKETLGSGYSVQYKCLGSSSFVLDVIMTYPKSAKEEVMRLQKGQVYSVTGRLERFSGLIGLSAVPE